MTNILTQEIRDLQLFSDPFEDFKSSKRDDGWTIIMVREGNRIRLTRDTNKIRMFSNDRESKFASIKSLLASDAFSNIGRLATAQRYDTRHLIVDETGNMKEFISCRGEIETDTNPRNQLSFQSVSELIDEKSNKLRIFVVDGVAGVGKTLLIERLVRERAMQPSYKSGKPLVLHVKSLGKVLTALDDRIAGTLSNLKTQFYQEELQPLVRRGIIHLAIDGFDELSDSRGYTRAWGALRDFIRDLDGKGTCILAGRDTMLNRDTVLEGLGSTVSGSSITILNLQYPEPRDICDWLSLKSEWKGKRNKTYINQVEKQARSIDYLRRPFFISRIAELEPKEYAEVGGDPISYLMESMILRESKKMPLVGSDNNGVEVIAELYSEILAETARLMMDDESNRIEVEILRLIAEDVFEGNLTRETIDALVQRVETFALFEADMNDDEARVFPHENIRSYFYSKYILSHFYQFGATNGMYRVPLSMEDFRIFNGVVRRASWENQKELRQAMMKTLRGSNSHGYLASNIGGLLLAFFPLEGDEDAFSLANLDLRDAWLADQTGVQRGSLNNITISRLDVRGADLSGITFENVVVTEMLVDRFVRFGKSVPEITSLNLHDVSAGKQKVFEPSEIRDWMDGKFENEQSFKTPDKRWKLLEKFSRISLRQYWIRDGDEDTRRITRSDHWDDLCDVLRYYGRLEMSEKVPASGRPTKWYHLVSGHEFLQYDDPECLEESTVEILKKLDVI